jgi:DNA excision repair protein ERCC-3
VIIQSDFSIFIETQDPNYQKERDFLSLFAQLEKSPEYIHTYKITLLSLWNAAASGISLEFIIEGLKKHSKFPVPGNILSFITEYYSRYGKIQINDYDDQFYLLKTPPDDRMFLRKQKKLIHILEREVAEGFLIRKLNRGTIKIYLMELDPPYPVQDTASLKEGDKMPFDFTDFWHLREYQKEAAAVFNNTGYGAVVLPCGAGKTMVGLEAMRLNQVSTLILVPHHAALKQWEKEIRDKTTLTAEDIGEYSGTRKEIKPVTIATYQVLTYQNKEDQYPHLKLFLERNWGLIIYDEVHILPAPVFKITAEIQTVRRLGLTATLIREDGREKEVFSLIGPKRYDIPWKELEKQSFIAEGVCHECKISLPRNVRLHYFSATKREKPRIAGENENKIAVVKELLQKHNTEKVLVIGQYISQLRRIADEIDAPVITGKMSHNKREEYYRKFRDSEYRVLVVSKVANLALDIPDASVAIQVSGTFGSRQEEAQRLGRILRPKDHPAYFYSVVTKDTVEEDFSLKRQMFLTEQGYQYHIEDWD